MMMKARALSHTLRRVACRAPPRCFSTLGDTLKAKERVEEDRFIRQQTEQQLASLRQAQEEKRQLRQQLWDDLRLENTMEDLQYILRDETISPEAMRRLAEWKTSGTV